MEPVDGSLVVKKEQHHNVDRLCSDQTYNRNTPIESSSSHLHKYRSPFSHHHRTKMFQLVGSTMK